MIVWKRSSGPAKKSMTMAPASVSGVDFDGPRIRECDGEKGTVPAEGSSTGRCACVGEHRFDDGGRAVNYLFAGRHVQDGGRRYDRGRFGEILQIEKSQTVVRSGQPFQSTRQHLGEFVLALGGGRRIAEPYRGCRGRGRRRSFPGFPKGRGCPAFGPTLRAGP